MSAAGKGRPHRGFSWAHGALVAWVGPQGLIVMSLTHDLTPRVSSASLVTSDFSASVSATPEMLTTPFSVVTLVEIALVERWLSRAYLTCEVIEASSTTSPAVTSPPVGDWTIRSFWTDFTLSMSFA